MPTTAYLVIFVIVLEITDFVKHQFIYCKMIPHKSQFLIIIPVLFIGNILCSEINHILIHNLLNIRQVLLTITFVYDILVVFHFDIPVKILQGFQENF
jgi:hypothetical protein